MNKSIYKQRQFYETDKQTENECRNGSEYFIIYNYRL